MHFIHVHASGRFDRPVALQAEETKAFARFADVVTRTEQSHDTEARDRTFEHPGWGWYQAKGDLGPDETVVQWAKDTFVADDFRAVRLSEMTFKRAKALGGHQSHPVTALHARLVSLEARRPVHLFVMHMPTDEASGRAEIWVDCCRGLRAAVSEIRQTDPRAKFILAADWNKNYRQKDERRMIRRHIARPLWMHQAWNRHIPSHGGTHGRALIDGDVANMHVSRAWLLRDTAASDHRPYAVQYRL